MCISIFVRPPKLGARVFPLCCCSAVTLVFQGRLLSNGSYANVPQRHPTALFPGEMQGKPTQRHTVTNSGLNEILMIFRIFSQMLLLRYPGLWPPSQTYQKKCAVTVNNPFNYARLAQSAERGANNATVTGSSPVFRRKWLPACVLLQYHLDVRRVGRAV